MRKIAPRHFYHETPYHRNNSLRGIRRAAKQGYNWIDLDLRVTKDGVPINCHWPRPVMRDGFRKLPNIPRRRRVEKMTWKQVRRLRTKKGNFRIQRYERMLVEAGKLGINVEIEAKDSPGCYDVEMWKRLYAVCEENGVKVQVKTLFTSGKQPQARLRAANEAGFETIALARGRRIRPRWERFINLVRGRWRR